MSAIVTFSVTEEPLFSSIQRFIVIIDPWAVKLDRIRQQLAWLDGYDPRNWTYVVVSDARRDTQEANAELRKILADTLRNTYRSRSSKVHEVRSESELTVAITSIVTTIQLDLISRADADATRPILSGPGLPKP